jgi:hypothetical protein
MEFIEMHSPCILTSTKDWWKIAEQISNFENKKEIISPIKVNDDLIYDNKKV